MKRDDRESLLILVPTILEREELRRVAPWLRETSSLEPSTVSIGGGDWKLTIEICGFGPVAAAATTARFLMRHEYQAVMLVGIAGTYGDVAIGDACTFESVAIDGLGANSTSGLLLPSQLDLPQWVDDKSPSEQQPNSAIDPYQRTEGANGESKVFERLPLLRWDTKRWNTERGESELLTVCAASGDESEAHSRKQRFPSARGEDMEGFGVALACRMADCPLSVIRGMSNQAGDRAIANWKISAALSSAADRLREVLKSPEFLQSLQLRQK